MLFHILMWFVPELALAVPAGLQLDVLERDAGWLRGRIRVEGEVELTFGTHHSGTALRLGGLLFLDPESRDPDVAALRDTRVCYPLAAARPAAEGVFRQGRALAAARLRPESVSLTVGEPADSPPWLLATWWYREDLGRPQVRGSVSGRIELPPELRLEEPTGSPARSRGGDVFIGPFDMDRDFDGGVSDAILLLDELDFGPSGFLHLNEHGANPGVFTVFGALAGDRREPEGVRLHAAAHVRDGGAFVAAFETGGELALPAFSAMLRWAAERELDGERLVALAALSEHGERDRALAITSRAERFWKAEEGRLYELTFSSGGVRIERSLPLLEGAARSGDRVLGWTASSADGWTYVFGSRRSTWTCTLDDQPPFPWLEHRGEKRKLLAGSALAYR